MSQITHESGKIDNCEGVLNSLHIHSLSVHTVKSNKYLGIDKVIAILAVYHSVVELKLGNECVFKVPNFSFHFMDLKLSEWY